MVALPFLPSLWPRAAWGQAIAKPTNFIAGWVPLGGYSNTDLYPTYTADIPLAADIVAKGAAALNPRGELYTDANVGERLAMRNLVDDMRGGGRTMRGPSSFTARDRQAFANQLDRWLASLSGDIVYFVPNRPAVVGNWRWKAASFQHSSRN